MSHRLLGKFWRDDEGASAIEFALLAPVLLVTFIGAVTMFDLFRNAQNVDKATFTVGDILSRKTSVTMTSLDELLSLVQHTLPTASDAGLRVSSIAKKTNGALELQWSEVVGNDAGIGSMAIPYDLVPDIAEGDSVVLTESFVPHRAFVPSFGLDQIVFNAHSVNRPRFVSAIPFQN